LSGFSNDFAALVLIETTRLVCQVLYFFGAATTELRKTIVSKPERQKTSATQLTHAVLLIRKPDGLKLLSVKRSENN